jgi:prophage DNA circulation protein
LQDKYGIELDANINGFKAKMKEASGEAKNLGQQLKTFTKGAFVNDQYIDIFSNKISIASGEAKNLGNSFKLVRPAVEQTSNEVKKLDNNIKQTGNSSKTIGNNISNSFNKGLRSVRRLTLGFIGARSLFALFRQQVNAYRGENEVFNQQMMLTTNIITTALAPAFEFFGNVIQYATLGLAKIIDIMFGTNISAKVLETGLQKANNQLAGMSSGMNDVSDSAKEMKDNLLGIDEITNLNDEDTGTGLLSGIGGGVDMGNLKDQFAALDELKKKMKEVQEWFDKHPGVVNFFKTLGGIIKDFVNLLQYMISHV